MSENKTNNHIKIGVYKEHLQNTESHLKSLGARRLKSASCATWNKILTDSFSPAAKAPCKENFCATSDFLSLYESASKTDSRHSELVQALYCLPRN